MSTHVETNATWPDAIADYESAQLLSGLAASTVHVRVQRLLRLTADAEKGPFEVISTDLVRWFDELGSLGATPATIKAERQALRSFFLWARATKRTAVQTPKLHRSTYTKDQRWQDALDLFATAQRAAKIGESTIALRLKHVGQLAGAMELSPWELTYEHLHSWLDSLPCSRETRLVHRSSLRAFYRWAHRTGRVAEDPTDKPDVRRLYVPAAWETEIRSFRTFLRSSGKSEPTVVTRLGHIERFARANPSLEPWAVTLDDLVEYAGPKRWSSETRRGWRSSFRSFYAWAVETGRIDENPALRLAVTAASPVSPRPAPVSAVTAALAAADSRETLALRLACELGMRRAEVARVHSSDVIYENGAWSLRVFGKGRKERLLPLTDTLRIALQAQPEGYVFPGQIDGHISPRHIGNLVSRLLPAGVAMHSLRHRFATTAYNLDRDVFAVQTLLGHSSPVTTQRYVQVSDANLRRVVEAVGA